jgi:hypothetical protein
MRRFRGPDIYDTAYKHYGTGNQSRLKGELGELGELTWED